MSRDFPRPELAAHGGSLEVHLLGLVDLDALIGLQEYLIYELSGRDDRDGILFLCEHPPTISMGREASLPDILIDDDERKRQEISVRWVSRGGGAIAHGPGQLSLNLLIPLQRIGIGLGQFRQLFEDALLAVCRELKIPAKRQPDSLGLWSRNGQLAYFGAGVRSWISCHGMLLNISTAPEILSWTVPNPHGTPATSMRSQRLDPVRMPMVREAVIRHLADQFGYCVSDISTGHPLLKRPTRKALSHV